MHAKLKIFRRPSKAARIARSITMFQATIEVRADRR
jgi:hypothetical protein